MLHPAGLPLSPIKARIVARGQNSQFGAIE
jgi:hypothetical protein